MFIIGFDLDNTIYRESTYLKNVIIEFSNKTGKEPLFKVSEETIESLINRREKDILSQILKIYFNINTENCKDYNLLHDCIFEIYLKSNKAIDCYEDFYEIKSYLENKKNFLRIFLITNGIRMVQMNKIRLLGILDFFDDIIILNKKYQKPNDYIFKKLKNRFPNYKRIYIGDDPINDFIPANKNGFLVYRVCRGFFNEKTFKIQWEEKDLRKLKEVLNEGMGNI